MKIRTNNPNIYGKQTVLPIDGVADVDVDGEVEVTSSCADLLLKTPNWELVETEEETVEQSDNKDLKKKLFPLKKAELIAICEEQDIKVTSDMTKMQIIEEIIKAAQ